MTYRTLALADFCKTGSGGTPSRKESAYYNDGTIPWVKSGELRENVIFDTEEHITDLALKKTSVKLAPKGAILLGSVDICRFRILRYTDKALRMRNRFQNATLRYGYRLLRVRSGIFR